MAKFARWISFIPAAIFMGFVMLVEVNNVADWLSGFPAVSRFSPVQFTLGDLFWPMVFVLVAAFVAPAGRIAIAWFFAILAVAAAFTAGGSLSLYWLPALADASVPGTYQKIGLGMTVAGALLGVAFVALILRSQGVARRVRPARADAPAR